MKLADIGIGKYEGQLTGTVFGTSLYLAPEVCKGRMYDSRADMYSFGFVLWELWYGEVSFRNMVLSREPSKLLEDIKCGLRPSHIDKTSEPFPSWREVMESCWEKDPKERMKAGDALKCLNQAKLHSTLDDVVDQPQIHLIPVSGGGSELSASQEVEYFVL